MAKKQEKLHDLRDDIYKPRTSVTDTEERFAGAEPPSVVPDDDGLPLVTPPAPGKGVPEGASTKG
jgi:hypothetical protein